MDKQKFKAMLIFLIPQLVKEIVDRETFPRPKQPALFMSLNFTRHLRRKKRSCGILVPRRSTRCMQRKSLRAITYPEEA